LHTILAQGREGGGEVHSWIIVCTYSSQGSDMLEVLSASIEAAMQVRNHVEALESFLFTMFFRYYGEQFCYCFLSSVPSLSVL